MTDQPGEPKGIPTSLESFLYLLREIEVAVERDALQWDAELLGQAPEQRLERHQSRLELAA